MLEKTYSVYTISTVCSLHNPYFVVTRKPFILYSLWFYYGFAVLTFSQFLIILVSFKFIFGNFKSVKLCWTTGKQRYRSALLLYSSDSLFSKSSWNPGLKLLTQKAMGCCPFAEQFGVQLFICAVCFNPFRIALYSTSVFLFSKFLVTWIDTHFY